MVKRKHVLILLCITVFAPIVLYTDRLSSAFYTPSNNGYFDGVSTSNAREVVKELNVAHQVSSNAVKEQNGVSSLENLSNSDQILTETSHESVKEVPIENHKDHKSRVLSAAEEKTQSDERIIQQVTEKESANNFQSRSQDSKLDNKEEHQSQLKVESSKAQESTLQQSAAVIPDAKLRQLKDQLIRARVYQSLGPLRTNPHFIRELRARIREVQRVIGDATKDSELPKSANEKLRLMEQTLAKAKQIQDDCSTVVKKLRAMLHSSEEQLKIYV